MAQTLVPMRELVTTLGYDDDGNARDLWATCWMLRGEIIDQTPWCNTPAQAIRAGLEADEAYHKVLVRAA
jgi:hypothetical protein